jgi:hypothetical protein
MRFAARSLLILTLSASFAGAVTLGADREPSKTFSFANYIEQDARVTVLVDTFTAAIFENEPYVPLQIAVGVRRRGPVLIIGPESFELSDRDGRRYPLATYEEVLAEGQLLERVDSVRNRDPIVVGQKFANMRPVRANFFPAAGTSIAIRNIELPREHFFVSMLYFPFPDGGLEGVLTLRFQPEGIPEPIDVRIEVPLKR